MQLHMAPSTATHEAGGLGLDHTVCLQIGTTKYPPFVHRHVFAVVMAISRSSARHHARTVWPCVSYNSSTARIDWVPWTPGGGEVECSGYI